MMVPVKDEGRVVGVVQLMSDEQPYTAKELEVPRASSRRWRSRYGTRALQKEHRKLEAAEAAARAAAAEREQAAQVLDAVGDGVFLVDARGVMRLWNRAAQLITGLDGEAPPRAADRGHVRRLARARRADPGRRGPGAARARSRCPSRVGGRDLWLSFVAVRGADGVVYAFRDVSGERRLEEEKSDFVATISHELRTPMSAVYGAAETLRLRNDQLRPSSGSS